MELPTWAAELVRAKLGDEPVTRVEVLKDTPFHKMLVGITPTRAILAERGLFSSGAYELPAPPRAQEPVALVPQTAAKPKARPRKARKAEAPRGKVKPRRTAPRAKPAPEPAPPEAPSKPRASKPREPPNPLVQEVEGIGAVFGRKLAKAGVTSREALLAEGAAAIADRAELPEAQVAAWQAMARLQALDGLGPQYSELLVRAGVTTLDDLAAQLPEGLAIKLNAYQDSLGQRVQGSAITAGLVEGWIRAARQKVLPPADMPLSPPAPDDLGRAPETR
jgi:predicted flap endonuclease-1-like 5' DNA nuclease